MEIIKVGSLYSDGEVVQPGSACPGRVSIGLGNTVPGMELQWVKDGDRLIADRCVCVDISWNKLDQQGYIFGRTVMIDGNPYRCRSLKMESSEPSSNEWFDLLDKYGDAIELWNWNIRSFGQETCTGTMENKKICHCVGGTFTFSHLCGHQQAQHMQWVSSCARAPGKHAKTN